jgi:hypothetical protein
MRCLSSRSLIGLISGIVLLSGLALPYEAFAEKQFMKVFDSGQDCSKCPQGDLDQKKSDPDRKGHKINQKVASQERPNPKRYQS